MSDRPRIIKDEGEALIEGLRRSKEAEWRGTVYVPLANGDRFECPRCGCEEFLKPTAKEPDVFECLECETEWTPTPQEEIR